MECWLPIFGQAHKFLAPGTAACTCEAEGACGSPCWGGASAVDPAESLRLPKQACPKRLIETHGIKAAWCVT